MAIDNLGVESTEVKRVHFIWRPWQGTTTALPQQHWSEYSSSSPPQQQLSWIEQQQQKSIWIVAHKESIGRQLIVLVGLLGKTQTKLGNP